MISIRLKKLFKIYSVFIFSIFLNLNSFAQNVSDSISIEKPLGQNVFFRDGHKIKHFEMKKMMASIDNKEASFEYGKARKNLFFSFVSAAIGGYLIGYNLGYIATGRKVNTVSACIGVGLIVVHIPFLRKFNQHSRKAVSIYNSNLKYR